MARDYGMSEQPAMEESASRMNEQPPAAMTLESVTIRPVENGFVVQCSKRAKDSGGNGPSEYQPPKEYAFNSAQEALRYAAQELGGVPAEAEPAEASELMA